MNRFTLLTMVLLCWLACVVFPSIAYAEETEFAGDNEKKADADSREEIWQVLDKKVTLQAMDARLSDVVQQLGEQAGVTIIIDSRVLDAVGLDPDSFKVTRRLEQLTLRTILQLVLREVGLTWIIRDGAVVITTVTDAEMHLETEVFNVADIVHTLDGDYDTLIEVVVSTIEPQSWDAVGGPGSVDAFRGTLVCSQTRPVLEQISGLLATLRRAGKITAEHAETPPPVVSLRLSESGEVSQAEEKIRDALEQRWEEIHVDETPLQDVVDAIGVEFKIPVVIDTRALDTVGLGSDVPIAFSGHNMKLRHALNHMLRDLELTWAVQGEVLMITTQEIACGAVETRVYPVLDLLSEPRPDAVLDGDSREFGFDHLIDLATIAIQPESWDAVGGLGSMGAVPRLGIIVVTQAPAIHEGIEALFTDLRNVIADRPDAKREASKPESFRLAVYAVKPPNGNQPQAGNPGGGFGGAGGGQAGGIVGGVQPVPTVSLDAFLATVVELIEPESWQNDKAFGKAVAGRLIVRHTESVHRKIRELAARLHIEGFHELTADSPSPPWFPGGIDGGGFF